MFMGTLIPEEEEEACSFDTFSTFHRTETDLKVKYR